VGRLSSSEILNGNPPLAPSAINANYSSLKWSGFEYSSLPKEMTQEEIDQTVRDFQQGTVNALEAGFDGVEIHGANGYIIHQFFAKCANKRTDKYGGSIENRARFLFEILDAIKEKVDLSKVALRIAPILDGLLGIDKDEEDDK